MPKYLIQASYRSEGMNRAAVDELYASLGGTVEESRQPYQSLIVDEQFGRCQRLGQRIAATVRGGVSWEMGRRRGQSIA